MRKQTYTSPVREYLESVKLLQLEQNRLDDKVARLETACTKITSTINGLPRAGNTDAQRLWAALADERARYTQNQLDVITTIREVEDFIESIETPLHRLILKLRYVDCLEWQEIHKRLCNKAGDIFYGESTLYAIHNEALRAAQKLYDQRKETP